MMKKKTVRSEIRKRLLENGGKNHRTGWIEVKCPRCDSKSKKRHLNVRLVEDTAIQYRCFRAGCEIHGILQKPIAKELGLTNPKLLDAIDNEYLRFIGKKSFNNYYKNDTDEINFSEDEISKEINDYFKSRTGKDLTKELRDDFRIFTNLENFYEKNKDYIDYNLIKFFIRFHKGKDYIYFLNQANTLVLYRQVNGDDKGKFSLITSMKRTKSHLPYGFTVDKKYATLCLHKEGSNTLILAEGPFDILNARLSATGRLAGRYVSSGGSAQTGKIVREFCKYVYRPVIVIFSDSDVNINYYKYKILKSVKKRIERMYVIYNNNGKDIGENPKDWDLQRYEIYRNENLNY